MHFELMLILVVNQKSPVAVQLLYCYSTLYTVFCYAQTRRKQKASDPAKLFPHVVSPSL